MRRYYGNKFYIRDQHRLQIEMQKASPRASETPPTFDRVKSLTVSYTKSWMSHQSKYIPTPIKIGMILFVALLFAIYGITQMVLVFDHFNYAKEYCASLSSGLDTNDMMMNSTTFAYDNVLDLHPELLVYDACSYKVYPFDMNGDGTNICDCRAFNGNNTQWTNDELVLYFDVSLYELFPTTLSKWKMLEKFQWQWLRDEVYNLTKETFSGKNMKIFKLYECNLGYIDEAISNWAKLEFFSAEEMENMPLLPDTMRELKNLQYLELEPYFYAPEFPEWVCELPKLKKIDFSFGRDIEFVPNCILKLRNLKYFAMPGAARLKSIPLELFTSMPNLVDFGLKFSGSLTIDSMMEYNNISDIETFDKMFSSWNENAFLWFQSSGLCDVAYDETEVPMFYQFLNETGCCVEACSSVVNTVRCPEDGWQNGECSQMCNNADCQFDGGDCIQLCHFDKCDYKLLGNGVCDEGCNTEYCNYDEYDCVELDNYDLCQSTFDEHGCNATWINDGWCDGNCRYIPQCGYDENDCPSSSCEAECYSFYIIFEFVANSFTSDDYIAEDELCDDYHWTLLMFHQAQYGIYNCTQLMTMWDTNENGFVSYHETLIGLYQSLDISLEKTMQLDCSTCVPEGVYSN